MLNFSLSTRIFVNDCLTKSNQEIKYAATGFLLEKKMYKVSTIRGNIYVVPSSYYDFELLFSDFNSLPLHQLFSSLTVDDCVDSFNNLVVSLFYICTCTFEEEIDLDHGLMKL